MKHQFHFGWCKTQCDIRILGNGKLKILTAKRGPCIRILPNRIIRFGDRELVFHVLRSIRTHPVITIRTNPEAVNAVSVIGSVKILGLQNFPVLSGGRVKLILGFRLLRLEDKIDFDILRNRVTGIFVKLNLWVSTIKPNLYLTSVQIGTGAGINNGRVFIFCKVGIIDFQPVNFCIR